MYRHWTAGDAAAAAAAAAAATENPEASAWTSNAALTAQDLQMRAAALGNLGYNTFGAANASPYLGYGAPGSSPAALYLHQQAALQQQQQAQQQAVALHHAQERAKAQAAVQQQQALQQQQQLRQQKLSQSNDVIEIDESDSDEEEPAVEAPKSKKDGKHDERKSRDTDSSKPKKNAPAWSPALKSQTAKSRDKEASTLALKAQTAKPEHKEASTEDLQARRKRERSAPAEDVGGLKRTRQKHLMAVVKDADQPVVVVQNWSREGLMEELAKNSQVHKDRMRESIFLHATGYTNMSAPESLSFPPKEIKMSSIQVEGLVANLVKDQYTTLQSAVDATFYKCAHYVNDMRGGAKPTGAQMILPPTPQGLPPRPSLPPPPGQSDNIGASAVAAETAGGVFGEEKAAFNKTLQHQQQLIKKQQEDMLLLRQELNKAVDEKKRMVETFRKEETYLKDQVTRSKTVHGRSVRAYMKASASSLQWLRERVDRSDDDDSCDEDQ
jgi:chemotaxis protein histidine kinase CheA